MMAKKATSNNKGSNALNDNINNDKNNKDSDAGRTPSHLWTSEETVCLIELYCTYGMSLLSFVIFVVPSCVEPDDETHDHSGATAAGGKSAKAANWKKIADEMILRLPSLGGHDAWALACKNKFNTLKKQYELWATMINWSGLGTHGRDVSTWDREVL